MARMHKGNEPSRFRLDVSWRLAATTVLVTACCVSGSINLGRVSDFMSGVIEISVDLELTGFFDVSADGDVGDWAMVGSFDEARVETDLSAATFEQAAIDYDVDLDASEEGVSLLRAGTSAAVGEEILFVSWRGDDYTVDDGVCYLGWIEGGDVKLAASYCDVDLGTMYCTADRTGDLAPACETCDEDGACADCDMGGSLDDCLPPKSVGGGMDIDVDVDIDIDIDIDIDVALDEEPEL